MMTTKWTKIHSSFTVDGLSTLNAGRCDEETVEFVTDSRHSQDSLGLSLSGSRSVGVFVKGVLNGGLAYSAGKLRPGDKIIRIDDFPLAGHTSDQAVRVLRSFLANKGRVSLTVVHPWTDRSQISSTSKHFDSSIFLAPPTTTMTQSKSDGKLANAIHLGVELDEVQQPPSTIGRRSSRHSSATMSTAAVDVYISASSPPSPLCLGTLVDASGKVGCQPTSKTSTLASLTLDVGRGVSLLGEGGATVTMTRGKSDGDFADMSFDLSNQCQTSSLSKSHRNSCNSDDFSLNVPTNCSDIHKNSVSTVFMENQCKNLRRAVSNETLPLASFDQLNISTYPYQSRVSDKRNGSSQSKSSKGSNKSCQSHELSWHCPVCLDGASRISRSKRRMMSTVCGHVFCSKCVEDVIDKYQMCPSCRSTISGMKDVHPLFM